MNKRHVVCLTESDRTALRGLIASGTAPARKTAHARILLKTDQSAGSPGWPDEAIQEAVEASLSTIARVRRGFCEGGREAAAHAREAKDRGSRKLTGEHEAYLVALTCSEPPQGRDRWTLRLLSKHFVALEYVDIEAVSHETIR